MSLLVDGGLEVWTDVNTLTNWGDAHDGTSNLIRNTGQKRSGTYCAELSVDGSNSFVYFQQTFNVTPETEVTLIFYYYMSDGSAKVEWELKDTGSNTYLQDDRTSWGASNVIVENNQESSYVKIETTFTWPATYTEYKLKFNRNAAANASIYIDDISLALSAGDDIIISLADLNPQPPSRRGAW